MISSHLARAPGPILLLTETSSTGCLAYYFDHHAEVDDSIRKGEAFAEALRSKTPSKLREKLQQQRDDGQG